MSKIKWNGGKKCVQAMLPWPFRAVSGSLYQKWICIKYILQLCDVRHFWGTAWNEPFVILQAKLSSFKDRPSCYVIFILFWLIIKRCKTG